MVVNLGAIDFTAGMYYNRSKFQSRKKWPEQFPSQTKPGTA